MLIRRVISTERKLRKERSMELKSLPAHYVVGKEDAWLALSTQHLAFLVATVRRAVFDESGTTRDTVEYVRDGRHRIEVVVDPQDEDVCVKVDVLCKSGSAVLEVISSRAELIKFCEGDDDIRKVVEHNGVWAHGGDPDSATLEWEATGLTAQQIDEYMNAGCFSPEHVVELHAAGVPLAQLKRRREGTTLGYWFCNDDMSLQDVLEWKGEEN